MTDQKPSEHEGSGDDALAEVTSIFDSFEPPPEIDPNHFGPVPIVGDDDLQFVDDPSAEEGHSGITITDDVIMIDGDALALGKPKPVVPVGSVEDLIDLDQPIQLDEPIELRDADELEVDAPTLLAVGETGSAVADGGLSLADTLAPVEAVTPLEVSPSIDQTLSDESLVLTGSVNEAWSDALSDVDGDMAKVSDLLPLSIDESDAEPKPADLPHWTEPATGQVPPVVSNASADGSDVWQDLSGPRWKGEGPDWAEDDIADVLAGVNDEDDLDESVLRIEDDDLSDVLPPAAGAPQRQPRERTRPVRAPAAPDSGGDGERNIPLAIAVGIGLAAIAIAAFRLSGNLWALGLITVVAVLAAVEVFDAMRRAGLHPATLLGITAAVSFPLAVYSRGDAAFPLLIGLTVVFGALWYIVGADTHRPALNLGLTFLGITWVGGMAAFAALILLLPDGKSMLVAAIIITVASDTFALAGGKAFGSRPFHSASPNKTWEGTIVGFVAAVAAGAVVALLDISPFSIDFTHAIYLGIVGGVLAPLGDLTESMIKRDLGVKDMGQLLPGHGGILDRFDGLLFVLPGTYYLALVLGLV